MRLLADENFPIDLVEEVRGKGHDVLWAGSHCVGWKDAAILDRAEREGRILITLDKDFLQIAVQRRIPIKQSGVVLFRVHPAVVERIRGLIVSFLSDSRDWAGHHSTLTAEGVFMTALGRDAK
jgi:predicted nuclease of predicted toxin-antitoxin system